VIGYTSLLLYFLGPSVLAGISAMLVIIPLNTYFLKKISDLKSKMLKFTDARVKLTNEILQGVRAIKSYNWERAFVEQLNDIRNQELEAIKASANTKAIFTSILNAAPSVVSAVTLGVYALLGNTLDSTKVFTALALFNQLRFPLIFLPMLFNTLADGKVSLWRLTNFLLADEIQNYVNSGSATDPNAAKIEGGTFSWSPTKDDTTKTGARGQLTDVNLRLKRGELVAIVGPVGAGKSTLLSAFLGELHKEAGSVEVNGRVAYVPQSSWIPNESIRNVILFGKQIDWRRYRNTVLACGLSKDLKDLEAGDQTEIGEKGVNLSGGQKQRISIARAVYDDADIYLFDDPLSALDTEVGTRVFRDCVKNLLHGKTRVLVTHQLSILPDVDRIIIMGNTEDGGCTIVDQGSFNDLVARGHDLSKSFIDSTSHTGINPTSALEVVHEDVGVHEIESTHEFMLDDDIGAMEVDHTDDLSVRNEEDKMVEILSPTVGLIDLCHGADCEIVQVHTQRSDEPVAKVVLSSDIDDENGVPMDSLLQGVGTGDAVLAGGVEPKQPSRTDLSSSSGAITSVSKEDGVKSKNSSPIRLTTLEERGEGAVSFSVYKDYLKAAKNPFLIVGIIASLVLANASQLAQQWIVVAWTGDAGYKKLPLAAYLSGVTLMAAFVGVFNWGRTYISCILGALASQTLHRNLARNVLGAPLSFFESTPIGRLVQRFSKDLDQIDQQLPSNFGQLAASSISIIGAIVAISTVTPPFIFYMFPVFFLYFAVTNYYRNVARELKRLDSLTRSPIYTHFSETLGGLPVIRSFLRQNMYLRSSESKIDDNLSAYVALKVVDRWLCVRLETLGNIVVFFSALLAVIAGPRGGTAGISLNNALSITSLLNWAVRNGADTESLMNSVERVLYTTNQTPLERPAINNDIKATAFTSAVGQGRDGALPSSDVELLGSGWPWRGGITISDAVMSYREDFEPVLKGVTLTIEPGESIGIVGRTG
jgi:ABC-type multidrug transport system fused ATPase/permease subunit